MASFFMRQRSIKTVAVLNLQGVISADGLSSSSKISFNKINEELETTFNTPNLSAIVLRINSPGGSPVQSELIYKRIRNLSTKKKIPVISFIEDCGASGGYLVACAGEEIYCSNSSVVGSIGVIASGFGFHDFIARHGIERRIYTQGSNKCILDPFLEAKDSDVDILNNVATDIHKSFIDIVKESRKDRIDLENEELFSGTFWSGTTAQQLGLVDGLGEMHEILEKKFGENVKINVIKEKKTFIGSLIDTFSTSISTVFMENFIQMFDYNVLKKRIGM